MSLALARRARVRVEGTVQGVGFRPYVYRLAGELELNGFVLNDAHGVLLEVEGEQAAVERFLARLASDAPPLAAVDRVSAEEREPIGHSGFQIVESPRGGKADAEVTADTAPCDDCLGEMFDPSDRRHRYPFTNCTNCGPRFTIVRGIPYDRPFTTMARFVMCELCLAEYEDPSNRRFHAQPNACPVCGPAVSLIDPAGRPVDVAGAGDPVQAAAAALCDGGILAVKGVGGYHLACLAADGRAVAALRARKHREDKPFALMVTSIEAAERLVVLGSEEGDLLTSNRRPIVLCRRREAAPVAVAVAVAPGAHELGVMLPYSPLHHLLLADVTARTGDPHTALVMTSGNRSDEPIAFRDGDARERLGGIADLLLVHDRPIETRTDDSVLRVVATAGERHTIGVRRSRGYVPAALGIPDPADRPLLACGAELKNTFCLARGSRAWLGHHIGDLENYETLRSFERGIDHFEGLFAVTPEVIVHDLHPEYLSTKYALERARVEPIGVQHHHAHLAAVLAEHDETTAVGAIFDGTGYGLDGTIWGGEILYGGLARFERVGALLPVRMPGGAQAIRQPWRMACAWLTLSRPDAKMPAIPAALAESVDAARWEAVAKLSRGSATAPVTTSMGRLFDAVSALCGVCPRANYEGQAAIEFEALCDVSAHGRYPITVSDGEGGLVLDPRDAVIGVAADIAAGIPVGIVAHRFHAGVSHAAVEACTRAASACGTDRVVLAGGVFQNRLLLESVAAGLAATGLRVLLPRQVPINDGGISYGQAAIAAHLMSTTGG